MKKIKLLAKKIAYIKPTNLYDQFKQHSLPFIYSIDSPKYSKVDNKTISIEGWLIPAKDVKIKIRAGINDNYKKVSFGLKRPDVQRTFPDNNNALKSGFKLDINTVDGLLSIEVDWGEGYKQIYSIHINYSPEKLISDLYNPKLAENYAEHINLIDDKKKYYYEEPLAGSYKRHKDDTRLIAFYLPQFYPIPENNKAWGKGFTEWTNVASDTPRFIGHMQPILPKDMGFYDLRLEQNIGDQIRLAKKHGIYAFCFYYYWFSGKRLLEKPLDSFLSHKEWNFNFVICWANENWTKRWDGRDDEIIISQKYNDNDPLNFIKDIEHILLDPRYVKENGKPILVVYRASELKDPKKYTKTWREYFYNKHNKELYLIAILSFNDTDPRDYGFDVALDFAPQSFFFKSDSFTNNRYPYIDVSDKLLDINFKGSVANYREIALNKSAYNYFKFPIHKCITPSWDNDARKNGNGFVMANNNPVIYERWLDNVLSMETSKKKSPLVFINAWNEWAEGAVLEPNMHYGTAILNRTTESLARYSHNEENSKQFVPWGIKRKAETKLAVIIHLYHIDRWHEIIKKISLLDDYNYDLFITINKKDREFINTILSYKKDAHIYSVPNRGRDILPFLHLLPKLKLAGYQYILKIHSKKSLHRENGSDWFIELINSILPSKKIIDDIMNIISTETVLVGPAHNFISLERYIGANKNNVEELLISMYNEQSARIIISKIQKYGFFAGSMYWADIRYFDKLEGLLLSPEDFESERKQIDGTKAHAIERVTSIISILENKKLYQVSEAGVREISKKDINKDYDYAS